MNDTPPAAPQPPKSPNLWQRLEGYVTRRKMFVSGSLFTVWFILAVGTGFSGTPGEAIIFTIVSMFVGLFLRLTLAFWHTMRWILLVFAILLLLIFVARIEGWGIDAHSFVWGLAQLILFTPCYVSLSVVAAVMDTCRPMLAVRLLCVELIRLSILCVLFLLAVFA